MFLEGAETNGDDNLPPVPPRAVAVARFQLERLFRDGPSGGGMFSSGHPSVPMR